MAPGGINDRRRHGVHRGILHAPIEDGLVQVEDLSKVLVRRASAGAGQTPVSLTENDRKMMKTIGKPWENHGKTMEKMVNPRKTHWKMMDN